MEEVAQDDTGRVARLLLLGLGVAVAWVVISLFSPTTSASADDSTPPDGGVLGLVHHVVGVADQTVSSVGAVVPGLAPVTDAVTDSVDALDTTVTTTTQSVGAAVDGVPVTTVTAPVLTAVDTVVDAVPVVNELVDATGLVPTLAATTHVVDTTLATLVVGPAPLLPPLGARPPVSLADPATALATDPVSPLPALLGSAAFSTAITDPPTRPWGVITTAGHAQQPDTAVAETSAPPTPTPPPPAGGPGCPSMSGTGGLVPPSGVPASSSPSADAAAHLTPPPPDDDAPTAPVFETDATPD